MNGYPGRSYFFALGLDCSSHIWEATPLISGTEESSEAGPEFGPHTTIQRLIRPSHYWDRHTMIVPHSMILCRVVLPNHAITRADRFMSHPLVSQSSPSVSVRERGKRKRERESENQTT